MKIQPYVEKLNSSSAFKEFKTKYPASFMVAGFFVLDLEVKQNVHQLDYYVPSERKIAAFSLDKHVTVQLLEMVGDKKPEELDIKTNVDLDALEGILKDEMKNRNMTEEIKKIIAVLQTVDGKKIWNLNCVLSGMEILKAHIEDNSKTVLKMEKISLMDIMKKIPNSMTGMNKQLNKDASKEDIEKEIEKLDKVEEEIEKEKKELQKNLKNKEGKSVKEKK